MKQLSPIEKCQDVLRMWSSYVTSKGATPVVIEFEGGTAAQYKQTCESLSGQKFACLHRSVTNKGKPVELVRFPYFDVEAVCDDRPSGKMGMTGDPRKIAIWAKLMGGVPIPAQ